MESVLLLRAPRTTTQAQFKEKKEKKNKKTNKKNNKKNTKIRSQLSPKPPNPGSASVHQ